MSSVDPLLDAPREETHDHCHWPTYSVLQVAPKERGGAGRPHRRRGMHQERRRES
ncbi:unnamed protein product [Spirodela intermedia]|uniref:Uncharacterized protein n=1 Tax=Spirodela intermedia TaxID=51605 RepID=A0A7I8IIW4_SPIIN|nr:unnamed protein product [Spirodela intermedia]CAA6657666.1 unnamed protein product [Spirodela intermedia]